MTDPAQVTRAQKDFLRAFRQNPAGPAPADWPAPGVLRRWLKDRRFKKALTAVRGAIVLQTDFHLATAASAAARALQTTLAPATTDASSVAAALADLARTLKSLTDLLRLAHLRDRYTTPPRAAAAAAKRNPLDDLNDENRRILGPSKPMHYYEKCLNDAQLLKELLLYGVRQGGGHIYDQFLVSFPDELAKAHEDYDRRHDKPAHPATPG